MECSAQRKLEVLEERESDEKHILYSWFFPLHNSEAFGNVI
jgi:hypothetical protein